jgi:hypothetical protein
MTWINDTGQITSAVGFCYPACLPGWAWGFNSSGVCLSSNSLTPNPTKIGRAASLVAADALFFSTSLEDAIARCTIDGQGGGQHFNLGSSLNGVNGPRYSVEASPIRSSVYKVTEITEGGYYVHCNVYLRSECCVENLRTGPFENSSRCRRERAIEIVSNSNTSSLHSIVSSVLGDSNNMEFPICRNAIAPDYGISDHAVIFDLENSVCEVYRNSRQSPTGLAVRGDRLDDIALVFHLPRR